MKTKIKVRVGKIFYYMNKENLSKINMAKKCDISYNTLVKVLKKNENIHMVILLKIAQTMNIEFSDLIK